MQKGFATLEIIFAVLIISILVAVTIPNAVHVIDRVSLDYETKKIYTDLKFLQSFDRMTNMKDSYFNTNDERSVLSLEVIEKNSNYLVRRRSYPQKTFEQHFMPNGFKYFFDGTDDFSYIKFDDMGKPRGTPTKNSPNGHILVGHIRINSRLGKDFYIYFDSVGRFQPSRVEKY